MNVEQALLALGRELDYPPEPDVAARVAARLRERPRAPFLRRRAAVLALAAALLALAVAFAVPPARSAILELLRLRGATIERVEADRRPTWDMVTNRPLGVSVTLEEARRRASFRLFAPPDPPDVVSYDSRFAGGAVTFGLGGRRLFLTQLRGAGTPFVEKQVATGQPVSYVEIGGAPGYWIEGAHYVLFRTARGQVIESRAAGNVLLWERGEVLLRLEGAVSREEALRLAGTLRRLPV